MEKTKISGIALTFIAFSALILGVYFGIDVIDSIVKGNHYNYSDLILEAILISSLFSLIATIASYKGFIRGLVTGVSLLFLYVIYAILFLPDGGLVVFCVLLGIIIIAITSAVGAGLKKIKSYIHKRNGGV